jgi:nitrogen fixation protein FixH
MRLASLLTLLLSLPLFACGDPAADADPGTLAVRAHSESAAPALGENVLLVEVDDASGAPLSGATVTVSSWMPAHGHGSPDEAVVTETSPGHYRAAPVTLHMPGSWEITVRAESGAEFGERTLDWEIDG